jgi:medium-chain acyl-[acyl-carrier-protein] hydrolase
MSDVRWFVPLDPRPAAGAQLFGFPHAGSGPAALSPMLTGLPAGVELWSLNLPGRQARMHEPPRTDLDPLIGELVDFVGRHARAAFALFGYCGGALLAHLVARGLEAAGRLPERLFVGSLAAPDVAVLPRRLHLLPSDRLWDRLLSEGGIPAELAARVELRPIFEPALRADFALLATYQHAAGSPLSAPITVLCGRSDATLDRGSLLGWRRQTRQRITVREVEASHWLLEDAGDQVARMIGHELTTGATSSAHPAGEA